MILYPYADLNSIRILFVIRRRFPWVYLICHIYVKYINTEVLTIRIECVIVILGGKGHEKEIDIIY